MKMASFVRNVLTTRTAWLAKLMDPRRDVDAECGHPATVLLSDYKDFYTRGDIAARVVTIYPQECWSENPAVYETEEDTETEFETAWDKLMETIPVFSLLQRIDTISGIGRFGVLLLGTDDGSPLSEPLDGIDANGMMTASRPERKLLYLRTFDETVTTVDALENDVRNPRYGLPTFYTVNFTDATGTNTFAQKIHWSRIIHVADNRTNSEIYGAPRMEVVVNRLLDLKKTAGGSGEMFWKGGFPGLSIETQPTEEEIDLDKEATKEEIEKYMNGLQRYVATVGLAVKSLSVQVADPGPHVDIQLKLIAAALAVPWRIFVGSEVGQLASSQDSRRWNLRVARRRDDYVSPYIIRPFVDRLVAVGILPEPESYQIDWPDSNSPSDQEKAAVAKDRTDAIQKYVQAGADILIPPFHYLTLVLGLEDDEAHAIIEEAGDQLMLEPPEPEPDLLPAPRGGDGATPE
jgi:hypothetical protein